jgi:hypothetical protein
LSTKISVEGLSDVVHENLRIYSKTITEGIRAEAEKSIKQLVKDTKATAPVGNRKKHYRDNIKAKGIISTRNSRYIWYVDGPDYRLSHLLENGHALRNGGRTEGTHFIQKASEPILEQYVKNIEEVIRNG